MFLHDAVLESIMCGETEMPIESLASEIEKLNQNESGKPCGFETQFSLLSIKSLQTLTLTILFQLLLLSMVAKIEVATICQVLLTYTQSYYFFNS